MFARAIVRASIDIPVNGQIRLNKGDRICLTGEENHIAKLADRVGRIESEAAHRFIDLITWSGSWVVIGYDNNQARLVKVQYW